MKKLLNKNVVTFKTSGIRFFNTMALKYDDAIRFTIGEPDFDSDENVKNALIESVNENNTHYTHNMGLIELRKAISDYAYNYYHKRFDSEHILVTLGASEALALIFKTILNIDDEVIVFEPSYPAYKPLILMENCKYVAYDLKESNFQVDEELLNKLITPKTKAIIINSPNNPSGVIFNEKSLENIYKCVKDKDIFVINDDIYTELVYTKCPSMVQFEDISDQLIFIQSFSKSFAMSGYRLGFLIAHKDIVDYATITHAYTLSCLPAFIQKAGIKALTSDNSAMIDAYKKRRKIMTDFFDSQNIPYISPDGAFYLFVNIEQFKMNSYDFAYDLLEKSHVCVIPGRYFGNNYDNYVRMSYSLSDEKIIEGLERISNYIKTRKNYNDMIPLK